MPTSTPAAAAAARDSTPSNPGATTAAAAAATTTGGRAGVGMEGQGSPRARQRLAEAKALDREIERSEGVDGGG